MPRSLPLTLMLSLLFGPVLAGGAPVIGAAATPVAGADIQVERGVVYGEPGSTELLLDSYLPADRATPGPAVLLIHGGAWTAGWGSRLEMTGTARQLAENGFVVFNLDYRLLDGNEDHRWPAQLDDVQRAVRWVRAHAAEYGVDPERVCAYGYSAGAQLAAMLGVRETRDNGDPDLAGYSSRVDCVVALSGDLDLTVQQTDASYQLIIADLLGGSAAEQPEAYRDASPLNWVDAEAAPFLIVHGGLDDAILAEQSRQMAVALYEAGVGVTAMAIPAVDHMGTDEWSLIGPATLAFLEQHMRPES